MRTLSVNPWDLVNLDPTEELPDEVQRLFWYRRPLDHDNPLDGLHLLEELVNDGRDKFLRLVKLDRLREILPEMNLRRSNMRFWEDMLNFYSYPERNVENSSTDDVTYRINALEAKVHWLEKELHKHDRNTVPAIMNRFNDVIGAINDLRSEVETLTNEVRRLVK